jgi:hypothetical protein
LVAAAQALGYQGFTLDRKAHASLDDILPLVR